MLDSQGYKLFLIFSTTEAKKLKYSSSHVLLQQRGKQCDSFDLWDVSTSCWTREAFKRTRSTMMLLQPFALFSFSWIHWGYKSWNFRNHIINAWNKSQWQNSLDPWCYPKAFALCCLSMALLHEWNKHLQLKLLLAEFSSPFFFFFVMLTETNVPCPVTFFYIPGSWQER